MVIRLCLNFQDSIKTSSIAEENPIPVVPQFVPRSSALVEGCVGGAGRRTFE